MDRPDPTDLTDGEREALRALWRLGEIGEVARELDRSHHTVRAHLRNARAKLRVSSSIGAARLLMASERPSLSDASPDRAMPFAYGIHDRDGAAHAPTSVREQLAPPWPDAPPAVWKEPTPRSPSETVRAIASATVAVAATIALVAYVMQKLPQIVPWNAFQF